MQGKTIIMTFGRLAGKKRYKGFDEVMESLPQLARKIPDIAYLIAGDGDDKRRLQSKAEKLGIADRVVFAGYISEQEKSDHYRLADVYVMPSRGEGFGFVVLEALACGIPVVASKVDGTREAVRDGMLGLLVDPGNSEEIVAAIINTLECKRGVVPDGLKYFDYGSFMQRCNRILDEIWTEKKDIEG